MQRVRVMPVAATIDDEEERLVEQWHTSSADDVIQKLQTGEEGLAKQEAASRLEKNGPNELEQKKGKTTFQLFIDQLKDFMIIVLLVAAAISGIMGEVVDACVILAIVILNAVIGVVQQKKAESSLEALKKMSAPNAKVVRGGEILSIPARDVVAGDKVVLEAGDMVPADMRLTECINLKIQESALTGESVPVEKDALTELGEDAALGDRLNMAFSSSVVTYGRGSGYVVETGMNTQVGHIAHMLQQEDDRLSPLQQKLEKLGKTLAIAAIGVCVVIFITGMLYGKEIFAMFMTAVSLAVAAIPEGLPAISTIVLALSVQRMAKKNAIVRTLSSVETLGSATVICSDKTGTLTQNKMEVTHLYYDDKLLPKEETAEGTPRKTLLLQSCVLCSDARYSTVEGAVTAIGDPTEIALIDIARDFGMDKDAMDKQFKRVDELPFDSERKLMSTVNEVDGRLRVFVKGAVDVLIARCDNIIDAGGVSGLTDEDRDNIAKANDEMASHALRVLAMAYKDIDAVPDEKTTLESGLTFIGLTGMIDPPRPEARDAVAVCRKAGIRPVMITGDHKATAVAIAKSLDILREGDLAITGADLEEMSDEQLAENVKNISVYARISPEHKVRIVNAWRSNGQIVAMTGDGVNDAPALKNADIGAAMGIVGTEVAKEAADLILTDDNFATVVYAVEEGRRVYDNILKTIQFLLSCNVGEIITLFVATMLNWDEPLLPVHILWVNLVTDSLPALGLGVDPPVDNIMQRKAVVSNSVFSKDMVFRIIYQGVMIGCITLAGFVFGKQYSIEVARTMAFCVLAFSQLVHAYNVRSNTRSIFSGAIGPNKYLLGAVIASAVLMFGVLLIPPLESVFELVDLNMTQWLTVAGLCLVPVLVVEIAKAIGNAVRKQPA